MNALLAIPLIASCPSPLDQTGLMQRGPMDGVAGAYYHGDGFGRNCTLVIEEDGRFNYTWKGCTGTYDSAEGVATLHGGRLVLNPERPEWTRLETRFVPVEWGDRRYLNPEELVGAFGKAVDAGREPRDGPHGWFYLRRGDWEKKAEGRPEFPIGVEGSGPDRKRRTSAHSPPAMG